MDNRKTAIITGGARGIGRAIAIAFYNEGYNVVIGFAGNEKAAKETEELCRANGDKGGILLFKGDISEEVTASGMTEEAMEKFGRIDVLVNNAGITRDNIMIRMSAGEFDEVIATNLRGAFLMSRYAAKPMMKQRFGRIINISSVVGVHGNAGQVNYSASKAGLIGMSKSIGKELASRGITANVIAPGMIETDMTNVLGDKAKEAIFASIPAGRMGKPEDIANAALFLAREESGYINGQVLGVDGGMGM